MAGNSGFDSSMLNVKHLDKIINQMIANVSDSKRQIFEIGEQSKQEHTLLSQELKQLKEDLADVIVRSDELEVQARRARGHLASVSKAFDRFNEADIRAAYEKANAVQSSLAAAREMERQMRVRRDELERRFVQIGVTIDKADRLTGQVTIVLNYLTGDLRQVGEVVASAREQRILALKIIEALEEERKRLSREIHDGPAQTLAQVLIGMDIVERVGKKQGAQAAEAELRKYRHMVKDALAEVRRIIYDLRPMSLDDLGLVPTLEKYFHRLASDFPQLDIDFQCAGKEKRLLSKIESALFRVIQEAVQNVCIHAHAGYALVRLEYRPNAVTILVKDNGKGFNQAEEKTDRYGLIGMKERVALLDGELSIRSMLNKGTTVMAKIPIRPEDEQQSL
ncbi:MAG: histidine kinase [Sporolactobacillus sp.]